MIEVEVTNDLNASLFFLPIDRAIRGRLDFMRVREKEGMPLVHEYPGGIPGQRLILDPATKTLRVIEPLLERSHEALRGKIEAKGLVISKGEEFVGVDVSTCAYWLKRAIESKLAKVVRGELPPIVGKVRKHFLTPERPDPAEEDRLLKRQELAAKLAMMTQKQREEYDRILSGGSIDE